MNAEHWQAVQRTFLHLANLPEAKRESALLSAERENPVLAEQVRRMLASDRQQDTLLDARIDPLTALRADDAPNTTDRSALYLGAGVPQQIGAFRVVKVIGAGMSGLVLEAEQASPKRRVAIKLLHPGVASLEVRQRFKREADVLARLSHPGIASVIMAGLLPAPDERPYIVLEYIEGESLLATSLTWGWTVAERLLAMARICDAVQYAHSRGVIHRDLKPENIVVTSAGEPKVLDFGIARLVGAAGRGITNSTLPGELLGTAAYMSPEQAGGGSERGAAEGIDTRTDVYALGAITYHLLSGRAPVDTRDRTLPEVIGSVVQGEIGRLSRLAPAVGHDVEAVVHKALARDRRDRYAAASELAAELRRAANGEPVIVRPPSAWREVWRLSRAHPRTMVATLVVLGTIIAGVVMLERTRAQARQDSEVAARLADVLLNQVLDQLAPMSGTLATRRDIVRLKEDLARLAAARPGSVNLRFNMARLLDTEGDLVSHDHDYERAIDIRNQTKSILDELCELEPENDRWLGLRSITLVKTGDCLMELHRVNEGIEIYERALQSDLDLVRLHPHNITLNDQLYWSYQRLAAHLHTPDPVRSRHYFDLSRAQAATLLAMSPDRPGSIYARLTVLAEEASYNPAPEMTPASVKRFYVERLTVGQRLVQMSPTNRGHVMRHVRDLLSASNSYSECGLHEEAMRFWERAVALTEPMVASDPRDVAVLDTQAVMSNIGGHLLRMRGDAAGAIPLLQAAVIAQRRTLQGASPSVEMTARMCDKLSALAGALAQQNQMEPAHQSVEELIDLAAGIWKTFETPRMIESLVSTCMAPSFAEHFGLGRVMTIADEIEVARPDSPVPALIRAEVMIRQGQITTAAAIWERISEQDDECGQWAAQRRGTP